MKRILFLILGLLPFLSGLTQQPVWDDTSRSHWPKGFEVVEIPSTADGTYQKAYFHKTTALKPQPLIVSLHTWSGDYTQEDPLAAEIIARGYNYIHPDFRGANNKPEATGSLLVISDIEDAIRYAAEHSNTDPENVHIIGVSGGGMAALLAYVNIEYPVRSFSAWAPISDLEAWYWESVGRGQKYAQDILASVSADSTFRAEEARRRSPLFMEVPFGRREGSDLYIYTGIQDGYTGSVPITHSLKMFNQVARQWKSHSRLPEEPPFVTENEMLELVTRRIDPAADPTHKINGRTVYLQREYNRIHLTIFEGGHEMLPRALSMIPAENQEMDLKCNIFTIGDSNGRIPGGWVDQLQTLMPGANIFNTSQGGRTIGFDNNGREELNALRNVDSYLSAASEYIGNGKYDYIILCLGTNDTKTEFADRQDEAVANFEALLDKIRQSRLARRSRPKLIFVTPPPMGREDPRVRNTERNERLGVLVERISAEAERQGFTVVDVYHPMLGVFHHYAPDGTHMVPEGQAIIAGKIVECIERLENKRR